LKLVQFTSVASLNEALNELKAASETITSAAKLRRLVKDRHRVRIKIKRFIELVFCLNIDLE
jgi:hypothetical protein